MSGNKKSYIELLKEVAGKKPLDGDFTDTSQPVDTTGPMTDNILGYRGNGELQTHKTASQILERYYFDKSDDSYGGETIQESEEQEQDEVQESEQVEEQEQASRTTEPEGSMESIKKRIEKDITEDDEVEVSENEETVTESDGQQEQEQEEVQESDDVEQAVIQKLINEMEDSGGEAVSEDEYSGQGTRAAGKPDEDPESAIKEEEEDKENGEEGEDLDVDKKAKKGEEGEDEEVEEKCASKMKEWGTGLEEQEEEKDDDDKEEDEENGEEEEEEVEEGKNNKSKKKANEAGPVGGPLGHNKSSGITHGKYDEELQEQDLEATFEKFERAIEEEENKSDD